ncbi:MAG: hypothetical protein NTV51_22880, partial [Verrucomicrobia bacterium]|nr:hypothetical protein [Verrucomicrobiota bacterium]
MNNPHPDETLARSNASMSKPEPMVPASGKKTAPEFVLNETMQVGEPVTAVFERLAANLAAQEGELLGVMIFGALASRVEIDRAMHSALGETQWPVTWIEGFSCDGAPLAGLQAFAVSGRPVTRVRLGNRIVGSVYEDEGARHCLLGGLGPSVRTLGAGAQVQQTFGNLEWALDQAGFELADVVRTWFYNDDILAWYNEFNRVRSAHYSTVKFRTGSLPASTGI